MRALILLLLACVSLPVSAEELRVTITGLACPLAPPDCGAGDYTTPFTITYFIDTRSGQRTVRVGPSFFGDEGDILRTYVASNLAVTNYSAILGGQSFAFAAHTTGGFGFDEEGLNVYDFAGGAGPSMGRYFFDSFATPIVTAPEFATFQDPLASLLLKYPSTPCSLCGLVTGSDGLDFFPLIAKITVTPVPSPGPLLLFLTGLLGIALSPRGRSSTSTCAAAFGRRLFLA